MILDTGTALTPDPRRLATPAVPAAFAGAPEVERRFWEFFTTQLSNDHTRRAYFNAVKRFSEWCELVGVAEPRQIQPMHIAAFLRALGQNHSAPTVKQHLAALRMLLDWLVLGHIIHINPAHAVRGPKYSVKKGKTPLLSAEETRTLLDSIETRSERGLRDRALIGLMVYTFARVGAALAMNVEDYFVQGRRSWVRLHEKGGKLHQLPCHHNLDEYLAAYIAKAGIANDAHGPLFRSLRGMRLAQSDVYEMIRRRAIATGIQTKVGCHSFRATGITTYLTNGGKIEIAQRMANHESSRTTGLYDRRGDDVAVDEVERIII